MIDKSLTVNSVTSEIQEEVTLNNSKTVNAGNILPYYQQVTLQDNNLVYHVQPWMCVPGQLGYISSPILLDSNDNEISSDKWIQNVRYTLHENNIIDDVAYDVDTNKFVFQISSNTPFADFPNITENQLYTISLTLNWASIEEQFSYNTVIIDPSNSLVWNFLLYIKTYGSLQFVQHQFLTIIDQSRNIYTIGAESGIQLSDGTIVWFDWRNDKPTMLIKEASNIFFIVQNKDLTQFWMLIKATEVNVLHSYSPIIPETVEDNKFYLEFDDVLYTLDIPNFNYDNFYRVIIGNIPEGYDPDDINWG